MTGNIGTPTYIAPEIYTPPFEYAEKADIHSFGKKKQTWTHKQINKHN